MVVRTSHYTTIQNNILIENAYCIGIGESCTNTIITDNGMCIIISLDDLTEPPSENPNEDGELGQKNPPFPIENYLILFIFLGLVIALGAIGFKTLRK